MYICLRSLSLHPTDQIKFLDLNGTYIPHIRQLQISAAYVCVTIEHSNLWFTVLCDDRTLESMVHCVTGENTTKFPGLFYS
jgi:hypothetical protein